MGSKKLQVTQGMLFQVKQLLFTYRMEDNMAKSVSKDMTQGPPMKLIVSFFLPLMLGMLFQQFYSMMDTVIVGK